MKEIYYSDIKTKYDILVSSAGEDPGEVMECLDTSLDEELSVYDFRVESSYYISIDKKMFDEVPNLASYSNFGNMNVGIPYFMCPAAFELFLKEETMHYVANKGKRTDKTLFNGLYTDFSPYCFSDNPNAYFDLICDSVNFFLDKGVYISHPCNVSKDLGKIYVPNYNEGTALKYIFSLGIPFTVIPSETEISNVEDSIEFGKKTTY